MPVRKVDCQMVDLILLQANLLIRNSLNHADGDHIYERYNPPISCRKRND